MQRGLLAPGRTAAARAPLSGTGAGHHLRIPLPRVARAPPPSDGHRVRLPRGVRASAADGDRPRYPRKNEEPVYDSGKWRDIVTENIVETEESRRRREAHEAESAAAEAARARAQQEADRAASEASFVFDSDQRKQMQGPQALVTESMRARAAGYEGDDRFGDYLYELGQSDQSTNTTAGAREGMVDSKFVGEFLGKDSDIASGELRRDEVRKLDNLQGDWYICPDFMDAVVLHMAKNLLYDQGALPGTPKIPLILGVWGGKGMGKSFQTELIMRKLGANPIIMSAGELESDEAGRPGKLIRERYRAASNVIGVHGKMSALIINDLDAGCGRFKDTQVTVNNQIVMGTLMNLCDAPNEVSVGERWREDQHLNRVPIIVTGNDFSTLYAPLVRDGRMEKFFWNPSRDDIVSMLEAMFKDDDITRDMIGDLVDAFPGQSMDFFGAMKCRMYDHNIRDWVLERAGAAQGTPIVDLSDDQLKLAYKGITNPAAEDGATVRIPKVTLDMLMAAGRNLAKEQDLVNEHKLSVDYLNNAEDELAAGGSLVGLSG